MHDLEIFMKLLMISPVPSPPTAGNRVRVFNLMTILEHLGHNVSFAYVPYETADYKAMEKRLGRRLHILRSERPPFPSIVGRTSERYNGPCGLNLLICGEWMSGLMTDCFRRLNIYIIQNI